MLDDRLQAVANLVPGNVRVADIGTDHAYLAIELYKNDNTRRVIAADKNDGPCQAARKTIAEAGLEDVITVRQGDGLAVLEPGEVDAVCIAGMGGKLIADILTARPQVLQGLKCAVLQPQNAFGLLRGWLYDNGWHIEKELLAKVDGRIYEIILAVPGNSPKPGWLELTVGPVILQEIPALFREHIENKINSIRHIYKGRLKAQQSDRVVLAELKEQMKELEALLK